MDKKKSLYEFSIFGRVDLSVLFEEWAIEPAQEEYEEPKRNWALKYSYVYENNICALLFENPSDGGITYYRVLFYRGENDRFRMIRKVRFREENFFCVDALGIDEDLNTLFLRRSNEKVKNDINCVLIDDTDHKVKDTLDLYDIVEPQSKVKFVLVDGKTVLFLRVPKKSRLEDIFIDPHDLLDDCNYDVNDEEEAENEGKEGKKEHEHGDDTECHVEVKCSESKNVESALEELNELIGLDNIKERVNQILAFAKLQKLAKDQGRKVENINLNLSFLGNPGTAKTTVARIFARIMKENGILSNGDLIEVGRSDLVAKYTGQTAIKVKEVFRKAQGNVLFIDEAYSLVDSWENEYGDEAIATIVQEMENNRDDMIVIFAGYPDKMEKFLSRNPGLRSRVPFMVKFRDYTVDELTAIAKSEAARRGYTVSVLAEKKIQEICTDAMKSDEFGNGRFSRNLVEAAIMRSAARTIRIITPDVDFDTFFVLEDCDFTAPDNLMKEKKTWTIGFNVA